MLIDALATALDNSKALEGFWGKLDAGQDGTLGVASSARPFLIAARFAKHPQPTLVVVPGESSALEFARNIGAYLGEERVLRFFAREETPFDEREPDKHHIARRLQAAYALETAAPCVVVASAGALMRCLPPVESGVCHPVRLVTGEDVPEREDGLLDGTFESIPHALEAMGYENTGEIEGHGTYCVHGGTIDVFPGNLMYPVRLDFFGDEVDEIRRIVPSTGQTISSLSQVQIFPVKEYRCTEANLKRAASPRGKLASLAQINNTYRDLLEQVEAGEVGPRGDLLLANLYPKTVTLESYLPHNALVSLVEPRGLIDDATHVFEDARVRADGGRLEWRGLYTAPANLTFGTCPRASYVSIMRVGGAMDVELPVKRTNVAGAPDKLFGRLRTFVDDHFTVVFSIPKYRARQDMMLELVDRGLPICEVKTFGTETPEKLKRGVVNVVDTDIPLGMVIPKAHLALVSLSDTQGSAAVRTSKQIDITQVTFPFKPGDYVVHAAHGVALFKDLVRQDVGGSVRDYLLLEYAEDDKLYVPVEQLDRVTRYVGPEGSEPRRTRLNTSDWSRALAKARKATKKLAFDLVDIYTRRAAVTGYQYSEDTVWQKEMEDAFPYQETPDQLAAINDVKADMQSNRPMDRLVCGDVGFGKTEVALRAAFKATQDRKQVMVLCPTTILAQQHYTTFHDRFEPYGVRVDVLSRFRTPAQQKESIEAFAAGDVQVLVGTHRLLSRDVNPADLGLIIIDEEQRFGVGHKEQLKNMRESVDVLTLSATPIPRTLQMSLSGVRDMSLILTPPDDRRAVKVHVGEWDPDVVADAIRRELARKGQVYYVSNRVRTIEDAVARVQSAVGEARIGVAHGKMSREQIERVMEDFSAGELDVLVATTIIESGIDNPHTNTLIIEDAQRLGLAQMYQLKGRVGRSSVQAYAYFMFPENASMSEESMQRLMAIDEFTELGSGMRVAMKDLEIRGAGSMLGAEQSGNMSAVGFDLFAQMLAEAVNATREGRAESADLIPPALSDISVSLPASTYLSDEYVPDVDERVLYYRKIASADEVEVIDALERDLEQRHPDMPDAAKNFFMKARIKAVANKMGIRNIALVAGKLQVDPVQVSKEKVTKWRRYSVRYVPNTKKLTVPKKFFDYVKHGSEDILGQVYQFLTLDLAD
ncbi:MAG: transcription-repair coupling factor [Eggerthellales bacterium]|nr:transcription-repair coupling factor [Eggerthellales bacterium]